MEASDIVIQGAAAAGFAKHLVDIVKLSIIPSPSRILPLLAFGFSQLCSFLLAGTRADFTFNRPTVFIVILTGIAATGGAMLLTEVGRKADEPPKK